MALVQDCRAPGPKESNMQNNTQDDLKILIVDDDAAIRQGLSRSVESPVNSRVDEAGDCAAHLQMLARER